MSRFRCTVWAVVAAAVLVAAHLPLAGKGASAADDDSPVDYLEEPNCGGYDYPECGTAIDVPPELVSVVVVVDGEPAPMPVVVKPTSDLQLAIEFAYPDCKLTGGHVFIVTNNAPVCVGGDGLPVNGYGPEIPHECSTAAVGEPYRLAVDPSFFLDGNGATYGLEISNACATRSNRLPLDIVTSSDDDDGQAGGGDATDDDSRGCGG